MILYLNKEREFANYDQDLNDKILDEDRIMTGFTKNLKADLQEAKNTTNIIIAVTKAQFFENQDIIFSKIKELSKLTKDIRFVIDGGSAEIINDSYDKAPIEYTYNKNELKTLYKFEETIKTLGINKSIRFNEYFFTRCQEDLKDCWGLKDVVKANEDIEEFVKYIKKCEFTPYETMVAIHKYMLCNFRFDYVAPENGKGLEKNRSIVSMVHFETTKCVGYASFIKAVIDRLNNPNLTCETKALVRREYDDKKRWHAICSIDINDTKYEINGKYFEDPTLDTSNVIFNPDNGLAHCMYPIADLDYDIKNRIIRGAKTSNRANFGEIEWKNDEGRLVVGTKYWSTFKQGSPIPLSKTKKALKEYYLKAQVEPECIDELIKIDIEKSVKNINKMLANGAPNPFKAKQIEYEAE